jgi:hypothetical protein
MPEKPTTDFTGKTPAQTASIMKAEANGVKQNAERRIWPDREGPRQRGQGDHRLLGRSHQLPHGRQ